MGVATCLSTMSSVSLEEVAQAATAPLWFQLYVYKDREITRSLVERAVAAGYQALAVTIDTPLLGKREADVRNQFTLPEHVKLANFSGATVEHLPTQSNESGLQAYIASLWDSSLSWADIDWLVSISKIPVLVKGVLRGDDAQIALEHGVQGIIVSNHGGRQLDTALATIEALPEVIEAVNGQVDVLMDGGVRRGTDVLKALALGAKGVFVGRPILWGLGYDGEAGVRKVLSILHEEFDLAMVLSGSRSIAEITRDLVV
jgi:isopentenyl diphosphate isomerase/L-lactate dehydrogenase-like FMN-dependent dehydrogenase